MLTFMESHPDFALFRISGLNAKRKGAELWETLKQELNCEVGPEKTVNQWQSTWSDWKVSVKRKWREFLKDKNKTGGGPLTAKQLLPIEERLLSFLANSAVDGDGVTTEAGIQIPDISIEIFDEMELPPSPEINIEEHLPVDSSTPPPPRKKLKLYEEETLENQKKQLNIYNNIENKLTSINDTLERKNEILETISKSLILQTQLLEKFINK